MYFNKCLLLILMLQCSKGEIERDLFLTPKEDLQILGRTLFYNPSTYELNGTVPWEETLKHVTYLTLFTENDIRKNLSELRGYQEFMHAPYEKSHEEYSRFGDIITMARGWVEKSDDHAFREGTCESVCLENALAIWRVQKIRHRDPVRGFRYEMKFSVTPLDHKVPLDTTHNVDEEYNKSFILKDDEYPRSFNKLTRRSDSFEEDFSNERQARIVNHSPREEFANFPPLNIGELLKHPPKASSKVGYLSSSRNDLPTTYRPNYGVRYTKPEVYEPPQEDHKPVVTHHFHHHYFMNDADISKSRAQEFYHGNPEAIRIIEPPSIDQLSPRYVLTTTTQAPPTQQVFYKQQRPLYVQPYSHVETTTRPFIQSEQHFEEIHYSEPDPLYENVDGKNSEGLGNYRHSDESNSFESYPQVERPSAEGHNSLIEQIPQSAEEQGTHLSYVNAEQEITTTVKSTTQPYQSTRRTLLPKNKFFVTPQPTTTTTSATTTTTTTTPAPTTTTTSESPIRYATKLSPKLRNYSRSTTEQPILKWKPKRHPKQKEEKIDNSSVPAKVEEEKVITVTPSKDDFEIVTHKSVSKSVSVKVGNHSLEIPVILETTTTSTEVEDSSEIYVDEN